MWTIKTRKGKNEDPYFVILTEQTRLVDYSSFIKVIKR